MRDVKDLDLNLLPALQALLELRNVSRAAERLHLSQSAMSASLGRLRRHFNDDLLVRDGRAHRLTPFAEALSPHVDRALSEVRDALQLHSEFNATRSDREFVIAASDYVASVLLRHLLARIVAEAPDVRVGIIPTAEPVTASSRIFDQVDLLIGPLGFDLPGRSQPLFEDDFVVLTDPAHPLLSRSHLTVADIAGTPQAVGEFGGRSITPPMRFFAEYGAEPRVVARISGFAALPSIIEGTELVALVPRYLAESACRDSRLIAIELASPAAIVLTEGTFWHPKHTNDPDNMWLREIVRDAASELPEPDMKIHTVRIDVPPS